MLYLACTTIASVDLAHNRISRAKDWVSVDCGTKISCRLQIHRIWFVNKFFPVRDAPFWSKNSPAKVSENKNAVKP